MRKAIVTVSSFIARRSVELWGRTGYLPRNVMRGWVKFGSFLPKTLAVTGSFVLEALCGADAMRIYSSASKALSR